MARPLDCNSQHTLCLSTVAADASWQNFSALGNVFTQARGVLVINILDFFDSKHADLLFSAAAPFLLMIHMVVLQKLEWQIAVIKAVVYLEKRVVCRLLGLLCKIVLWIGLPLRLVAAIVVIILIAIGLIVVLLPG